MAPRHTLAATVLVSLLFSLLLAGCGGGSSLREPAPLPKVDDPQSRIQAVWSHRIGQGAAGDFLRLRVVEKDGILYAAARNGTIEARRADGGQLVWRRHLNVAITGALGLGGDQLLFGTDRGEVHALDRLSGERRWRAQVSSEVLSAPAQNHGVVAVKTGDGKLFGLDADDGEQRWIYDRSTPVLVLRASSEPQVVATHFVDGFASGRLVAMDSRTGELAWESTIAVPRGRSEIERMVDIAAAPAIFEDMAYVAAYQGRVAAVDLRSGQQQWSRDISAYSGLAVSRKAVYVIDERDRVWALDRQSGSTLWRQESMLDRRLSAPTVRGNQLVFADAQGYLFVLHREDGRILARRNLRAEPPVGETGLAPRRDRRTLNPPLLVDDRVIIYDRSGHLQSVRLRRND